MDSLRTMGAIIVNKLVLALPIAALLSACGSESGGGGGSATDGIKIVGSSTVYPFTKAVAEQISCATIRMSSVIVESTGTGAGMKLFCGGVGGEFPDIENASRQIKKSEYDSCVANGVKPVIEVPIGIDGLTIIQVEGLAPLNLTQADVYKALAANPFGKGANTAQTWKDVNPALPAIKIRVLGPPPTSGTRDSLVELYLEKGCNTDPAMKALKKSDEDKHKDFAPRSARTAPFVEAGENDNLLVQKVAADRARSASSATPTSRRMPTRSCRSRSTALARPKRPSRPSLSRRPQALRLCEGRASSGQAGAPRLCRRFRQAAGARAARSSSTGWFRSPAPIRSRRQAGDRPRRRSIRPA